MTMSEIATLISVCLQATSIAVPTVTGRLNCASALWSNGSARKHCWRESAKTFLFKGVSTLARMIPNRRSEGSLCGAKSLEALVRDAVFARPMADQVSRRVLEMIFP